MKKRSILYIIKVKTPTEHFKVKYFDGFLDGRKIYSSKAWAKTFTIEEAQEIIAEHFKGQPNVSIEKI